MEFPAARRAVCRRDRASIGHAPRPRRIITRNRASRATRESGTVATSLSRVSRSRRARTHTPVRVSDKPAIQPDSQRAKLASSREIVTRAISSRSEILVAVRRANLRSVSDHPSGLQYHALAHWRLVSTYLASPTDAERESASTMAAVEGYQNQAQCETQAQQNQSQDQSHQNQQGQNQQHQQQQHQQQQATAGIPGKDDERKLFIGGLSRNTTDKELRDHFGKFGEIESISVKIDPHTGISRGFAFMVFTNPKTIDKLLASGEHYINKRKVSR